MSYDVVVVGSGPNGLTAAAVLARAGMAVAVFEGAGTVGGAIRTEELTLTGYRHDVGATAHPLGIGSPVFKSLPLHEHGLRWIQPDVPFGHAVTPGHSVLAHRSLTATADGLGSDGPAYSAIVGDILRRWPRIEDHILGPLLRLPRHPIALARFGLRGMTSAQQAVTAFRTTEAGALFAGAAAHAFLPLTAPLSASFGWLLLVGAHRNGWPFAQGGSAAIADALASYVASKGGEIHTGGWIEHLDDLPAARAIVLDVAPENFLRLAGDELPGGYIRRVRRFRRGPAAFKIDYALKAPIPWADPTLSRAGTVHVGGTLEEVAAAEAQVWERPVDQPFMLVAQPASFDRTRAPEGGHIAWVYAHVPHGSPDDHTEAIESRLETFAPGFGNVVEARHVIGADRWESRNPNLIGGDITGGAHTVPQIVLRPFPGRDPYRTPIKDVYLCSASTPPGAGVHGMCGYHAARRVLADFS